MQPVDYPLLAFIPLIPLAGAALNLSLGKRLGKPFASLIGIGAVLAAAAIAWDAFFTLLHLPEGSDALAGALYSGDWIKASDVAGADVHITAGLVLDHLSGTLCLVITSVGLLIHIYSSAYMEHDEGFARYFGYLNLFTGAMLILVLGDSLAVTFVGWEGVGLCSYLLIGFWFDKEANAYAGRKAFIVNRIGDFGFLLGIFLIFSVASTLKYSNLSSTEHMTAFRAAFIGRGGHGVAVSFGTVAALLLFVGATGKSAQLPLYIWLPDAMAGPTPVSALIHAATMVTAGVYMVARLHFLFDADPFVPAVVSIVGAATALFAATMGITAKPIKKILAYSTISQLGFMFIGVGTGAYTAGIFHLVTHAFFKAGLFLGAGSIMHALGGEEDVFKMGGLRSKLPITHAAFLVYCLAIAGVFPFAGFFSKDAILAGAFEFGEGYMHTVPGWPAWLGHFIWGVGLVAAACTAFYMFRAYFLVFHGKFRGDHHTWEHAHESPPAMSVPLIVLAIASATAGFLGIPELFHKNWNVFEEWLSPSVFAPTISHLEPSMEWTLMAVATTISLAGIGLAYSLYGQGPAPAAAAAQKAFGPVYTLVFHKFYVDEIYDRLVVRPLRSISFYLWKVVDSFLIDLVLVRGSAVIVDLFGRTTRYLQNGDVQRSVVGVLVGTVAIVAVGANWAAWRASGFDYEVKDGGQVVVRARGLATSAPTRSPDQQLTYSFDFGDDSPPLLGRASPVAEHHYAQPGKHKIVVEVYDQKWHSTSRESQSVVVGGNTSGASAEQGRAE